MQFTDNGAGDAAALATDIRSGAGQLGMTLPGDSADRLACYLLLLERWNRVYNLTAIREPRAMVSGHVLDCLASLPWVRGPRVLDVGSGAGLPGIVLALAAPALTVTVLDSNIKKTRFLTQCVIELQLANVQVVRQRVQDFETGENFDTIVSRAFASFPEMVRVTAHLGCAGQRVLSLKGPGTERDSADPALVAKQREQAITVPGLEAVRRIVWLDRT
ncbi:MAG: 16S rRNA (guanine(527)-N(7))-methyltransferase RsmG [Gammaproteobacteria bacterium]|nr:16S rRNA (guanine(527)-N(7))-methyltransferase RsmG [Gammaproteobacteria bacterium]